MGLTLFPSLATQTIMIQLNNMTASYGKWYAGKGQGDISTFNWDNQLNGGEVVGRVLLPCRSDIYVKIWRQRLNKSYGKNNT